YLSICLENLFSNQDCFEGALSYLESSSYKDLMLTSKKIRKNLLMAYDKDFKFQAGRISLPTTLSSQLSLSSAFIDSSNVHDLSFFALSQKVNSIWDSFIHSPDLTSPQFQQLDLTQSPLLDNSLVNLQIHSFRCFKVESRELDAAIQAAKEEYENLFSQMDYDPLSPISYRLGMRPHILTRNKEDLFFTSSNFISVLFLKNFTKSGHWCLKANAYKNGMPVGMKLIDSWIPKEKWIDCIHFIDQIPIVPLRASSIFFGGSLSFLKAKLGLYFVSKLEGFLDIDPLLQLFKTAESPYMDLWLRILAQHYRDSSLDKTFKALALISSPGDQLLALNDLIEFQASNEKWEDLHRSIATGKDLLQGSELAMFLDSTFKYSY
ncbi:MAG: hypothetical protein EBZ47_04415, partial [Chlamydiae bacterium]|nr:hypothetical protein [Chlamydiota bacterium]